MTRRTSASVLAETLSALQGQSRKAFALQYQEHYKSDPPRNMSRPLLVMAIGYRLQEEHFGPLKPTIRRALVSGESPRPADVGPGTVLIRVWHGQHHRVTVYPDEVEYAGQRFGSLSEVARLITGHKRSGPAFFGSRGGAHVQ